MTKHFCDWCGKEIKNSVYIPTLKFPAPVVPYKNGEPCGEIEFDWEYPHTIDYDVCIDCLRKIWSLRHDKA